MATYLKEIDFWKAAAESFKVRYLDQMALHVDSAARLHDVGGGRTALEAAAGHHGVGQVRRRHRQQGLQRRRHRRRRRRRRRLFALGFIFPPRRFAAAAAAAGVLAAFLERALFGRHVGLRPPPRRPFAVGRRLRRPERDVQSPIIDRFFFVSPLKYTSSRGPHGQQRKHLSSKNVTKEYCIRIYP